MGLVIVIVVVALLLGGLGALIEGLFWLAIIGAVLLAVAVVAGMRVLRR